MIKIKDLEHGYSIEYNDTELSHFFHLIKDGVTVKESQTQRELEQYVEKIGKSENKFKTPIKVFQFTYDRIVHYGTITSANLVDESFWFINDDKTQWRSRQKEELGGNYYELTNNNMNLIAQIEAQRTIIKNAQEKIDDLAKSFDNQITKEYITAKQEQ